MKESKIFVVIKEPGKAPVIEPMFDNSLESFQKAVGGYIETVTISDDLVIICNEEGRLRNLPYNCDVCGVSFVGTIIFCGVSEDEFCDIPVDYQTLKNFMPGMWEDCENGKV